MIINKLALNYISEKMNGFFLISIVKLLTIQDINTLIFAILFSGQAMKELCKYSQQS